MEKYNELKDFGAPKVINLHYAKVRKQSKDANVGLEIVMMGKNYQFFLSKEDRDTRIIDKWVSTIQNVCDSLIMDSIGGKDDDNILSKSYSTVCFLLLLLSSFPPSSLSLILPPSLSSLSSLRLFFLNPASVVPRNTYFLVYASSHLPLHTLSFLFPP